MACESKVEWGQVLLMTVVGAYFRLPDLGALSLYGDEDYTALAVTGILSVGQPYLPSGMLYWRAGPFSYLAGISGYLFGLNEFSLRLPSAVVGTLTIPIFYALARRLIGVFPAILASWLLVFSAWHIDMSREARMYAMFLAFFLMSLYFFYRAFVEGQKSLRPVAALIGMFTLTLHGLAGLVVAFFGLVFVVNYSRFDLKDKIYFIVLEATLAIFWFIYAKFEAFKIPGEMVGDVSISVIAGVRPKFLLIRDILRDQPALFVGLVIIAAVTLYALWLGHRHKTNVSGFMIVGSVAIVLLAILNLFALMILSLFVLVFVKPGVTKKLLGNRYCQMVALEAGSIFVFWLLYGLMIWRAEDLAFSSSTGLVRKLIKDGLSYPALHIILYFEAFPVMTAVVTAGTIAWAAFHHRSTAAETRVVFLGFWLPLLVFGFLDEWLELRYTVMLYPFYLMIFAWTTSEGIRIVGKKLSVSFAGVFQDRFRLSFATVIALLLVMLPKLNEDHGVSSAIRTGRLSYHEPINRLWHGFPYHPDHKSPGEYVKANLRPYDSVIAMDVVQQYYYSGRVNYWLSSKSDKSSFSYPQGTDWYDIYTKTPVITQRAELEQIVDKSRGSVRTVWLITSGESSHRLSADVVEFIRAHDSNVVYVGRDNKTSVYRFDIRT